MRWSRVIVLAVAAVFCFLSATADAASKAPRSSTGPGTVQPFTADGPGTAIWPD